MTASAWVVSPTSAAHVTVARQLFPDLLVDRWQAGSNRRSFVAVQDGQVVGHVRGVDNPVHPDTRVLFLEVIPGFRGCGVGTALLHAQVDVSDRPLRVKLYESMIAERALARRFGAVAVQATPPWRHPVTPALRQWAADHQPTGLIGSLRSATAADAAVLLELTIQHYLDQHAAWSPAHEPALREAFSADLGPDAEPGFDPSRSTVLHRQGALAAAALVWPNEQSSDTTADANTANTAGIEVSLVCTRHNDPAGRTDMEACLAGVIDRCTDSDVLLIDSHLTETVESAMLHDLPRPEPSTAAGDWMAILSIPVPGRTPPRPMPHGLLPPPARWIVDDFLA